MPATTDNQKLKDWVDHWAGILQPDAVEWCDGSEDEWDRLTQLLVDGGTFEQLNDAKRPNSFLARVRPRRRRPGRRPHVHLLRAGARRRPHQQLAGAGGDEGRAPRAVHRGHAGPHPVRRAVLDGSARLAHRPRRRRAHRLRLRRHEHADHDPHGPGRPRRARRRRRLRAVPPLCWLPARAGRRLHPPRHPVAVRRRQQVHHPLPGDPRDLELRLRVRRQRTPRQEVLRAAHRVDDGPRRRLDGRAHARARHHLARG